MAAEGVHPRATHLQLTGYDLYRAYYDVHISGGWRELREPISQKKYWQHAGMNLNTWSLLELLRLNGLEEFLLVGAWNLFAVVPEKIEEYEDKHFRFSVWDNPEARGEPMCYLNRGAICASVGMVRPGIVELILPSEENVIKIGYGIYRFPPENGGRYLQRLPTQLRNSDLAGLQAVTVPTFQVLEAPPGREGPYGRALQVTETRDPRSQEMGWLRAGAYIGLNLVEGTRALLGWIHEEDPHLVGGWISIVRLDGAGTIERVLQETDNMRMQAELAAHLKELEASGAVSKAPSLAPSKAPSVASHSARGRAASVAESGVSPSVISEVQDMPKVAGQMIGPSNPQEQRTTVVGGWRQVVDTVWNRPHYFNPVGARATWGISEVLDTGGLDDLLLNRSWELCCIDPTAVEIMKQDDWYLKVYSDASLSGEPIAYWEKGRIIVVQLFEPKTAIATVLLPPAQGGGQAGTGYVEYCLRDGRSLLKAVIPPLEEPEELVEGQIPECATPPPGDVLVGPFIATPPPNMSEIIVSVGQDVGSDRWARIPRGYKLEEFEEVLGFRARLPDLEGGGWVSICSTHGVPYFKKQPEVAPAIDLPDEVASTGRRKKATTLPVVWPGKGVLWPEALPVPVALPEPKQLPDLLADLGQGRAVCDWERMALPPSDAVIWKNRYCPSRTTLHDLLKLKIWKPAVVKAAWLHVREAEDERSRRLVSLPRGSCIVTEWVVPSGSVRVLVPCKEDDPRPIHGWSDLGSMDGANIVLLEPGSDFWIEPKGGHLPEEEQENESSHDPMLVPVRETQYKAWSEPVQYTENYIAAIKEVMGQFPLPEDKVRTQDGTEFMFDNLSRLDASSLMAAFPIQVQGRDAVIPISGYLQRGDGVQIAELDGRMARLVHTKCVEKFDRAPNGGWFDIFCEAGWSRLRARQPGEIHPEELFRQDNWEEGRDFGPDAIKEAVAVKEIEESDEEAAELPALLRELGELETQSHGTRDWRENIDPVWGRRYFVNKWSGQVIHKLSTWGVAAAGVKLSLFFSNMSVNAPGIWKMESPIAELQRLEKSTLIPFAALADVPEHMLTVQFLEGPESAPVRPGDRIPASPPSPTDLSDADSIMGGLVVEQGFRVIVKLQAPGLKAAWASAGLRRSMANSENFTNTIMNMMASTPGIALLFINEGEPFSFIRADLEEMDIPRDAESKVLPPQTDEDEQVELAESEFVELKKNLMWARPKLVQFAFRQLGEVNTRAMAEGLEMAYEAPHARLDPPHLEEMSLWSCAIGDAGIIALAKCFSLGCGHKLQTLLLDDNDIGAAGATSLGTALGSCPVLRELGLSKNPVGKGFSALCAGIGATVVILDVSEASLDDMSGAIAAASIIRWPILRSLRLEGNPNIGLMGVEAIACAMLEAKSLQQVDLRGSSLDLTHEYPRLGKILEQGGCDPKKLRLL
eukprot:TRINITY_DN22779_c0_g1_i1.p1 TRINITY_DN22779_c0_g1~~TRINITY_DN22779_c0_g1_i1.p1  ORF type:complete len:1440 (+),score=236.14 TRINITY_DN22779_c0_g1_i1:25-4320(+)